jgi:hypothetical protein
MEKELKLTPWSRVLLDKLIVTQLVKKLPHILWKSMVYHHVHKNLPLVSVLSHMHPFHILPTYFPKIHFNIILPSLSRCSEWSLPFQVFPWKFCMHFSSPSYVLHEQFCVNRVFSFWDICNWYTFIDKISVVFLQNVASFKCYPVLSGLWHHVVLWYDTSVLEDLAASIFMVKWLVVWKKGTDIDLKCK